MTKIAPPDSDKTARDSVNVRGRSGIDTTDDGAMLIPAEIVRVEHGFVIVNSGYVSEAFIPIKEFTNERGEVDVKLGDFVFIPFDALKHGAGGICAFLPEALVDTRFAKNFKELAARTIGSSVRGVGCEPRYVISRKVVLEWATAAWRQGLLDSLEDGGSDTVKDGAVNDVTRPLDLAEQDAVLTQLPEWARERRTTEILLVDFRIGGRDDTDDLAEFVMEHGPAPIRASLIDNRLNDIDTDGLMALALFPSGAVRTVGLVLQGRSGSVMLAPFDYWSLIDPDGTQQQVQPNQDLRGQLYLFAVGVQ